MQIGLNEAAGSEVFSGVRDVTLDDARNIYVLDDFPACARVFSPDGKLVKVIGGRGEGPGECISPIASAWRRDTLLVLDRGALHLFVKNEFLRSARLGPDLQRVRQLEPTPQGTFVAMFSRPTDKRFGISVNKVDLSSGAPGPPILTLDMPKLYGSGATYWPAPLAAAPIVDLAENGDFFATSGDAFHIDQRSGTGELVRTIIVDIPRSLASSADVDEALASIRNEFERQHATLPANAFDKTPRPKFRPAIGRLIAREGMLIVERRDVKRSDDAEWLILAREPARVGRFTLPKRFRPYRLNGCFLTGVETGALDVPSVVQYRIKSSRPEALDLCQ